MVLASQTPRNVNSWRAMTNARRRPRPLLRIVVTLLGLAAVAALVWVLVRPDPSADASGDTTTTLDDSSTPATVEPEARPASRAAAAIRGGGAPAGPGPIITLGGGTTPDPVVPEPPAATPSAPPAPEAPLSARAPEPLPSQPPAGGAAAPPKGPPIENGGSARRAADVPSPEPLHAAISLAERDPVAARDRLTAIILDPRSSPAERSRARETAGAINRKILFSPLVLQGDPAVRTCVVQPGDTLQKIVRSQGLETDWRFLKRINGIADERQLKSGQTLKIVPGTFHAEVDKSAYRMDLYLDQQGRRIFVCSLPVGLGELNSTPTGRFKVRESSRLVNPAWTNPRTGEHFRADDPKNPIGEYWIGLRGLDAANQEIDGYGIHGTIDPASIGRQISMGCVRLAAPDIALVYEVLSEPGSVIEIRERGAP